jgi:hypothetical protein
LVNKTDEMAAVWLTLGSLAKDVKDLRRDYKRLLSALRRHEPGPMYEFADVPDWSILRAGQAAGMEAKHG